MSEVSPEPTLQELSARLDRLDAVLKWVLLGQIVCVSIFNIWLASEIGTFEQIFRDGLPGKVLPWLTRIVVSGSTILLALSVAWPLASAVICFLRKKSSAGLIALVLILILIGLQYALTYMACYSPLFGLVIGMADEPGK